MQRFDIELSSWILADGNYEFVSFEVGNRLKFALEFNLKQHAVCFEEPFLEASEGRPSFYNSIAKVIFFNESAWVLDFGSISAYRQGPPMDLTFGQRVKAALSLHVDPFHYYEELSKLEDIPPLIYEWELTGIHMNATPFSRKNDTEVSQRFIAIDKIDSLKDRELGCNGSYILHCTLADNKPTKTM